MLGGRITRIYAENTKELFEIFLCPWIYSNCGPDYSGSFEDNFPYYYHDNKDLGAYTSSKKENYQLLEYWRVEVDRMNREEFEKATALDFAKNRVLQNTRANSS